MFLSVQKTMLRMADAVYERLTRWIVSILGGLLIGVEASIPFFLPCTIVVVLDVWSAVALQRRLRKIDPRKYDGKFKSCYWKRVACTFAVIFMLLILANHVDRLMLSGGSQAISSVMFGFLIYQGISILENWSTENPKKGAKLLQKILVSKADRHLNVDISDLFEHDATPKENDRTNINP